MNSISSSQSPAPDPVSDDLDDSDGLDQQLAPYVHAALALHGYQFPAAEVADIIVQFSRIEALAQTFLSLPLPLLIDAAPVFRP